MLLIIGLITGILFGIFLQSSEVIRFDKQVNFLRLKDFTIIKYMLSAIVTAMILIYGTSLISDISFSVKPTIIYANITGGIIFGIGWAILGYCPGTMWGALGEGRYDSIFGILGGLSGGFIFALIYPSLKKSFIYNSGNFGKVRVFEALNINPTITVIVFAVIFIIILKVLNRERSHN